MDERDNETDITITSDGNGTYTIVIGSTTYKHKTWDECMAIISGKELKDAGGG